MATKRILENQSVLDAVTQYLGTAEASFDFCLANDVSISDDLIVNDFVEIPESVDKIVLVSDYFAEKSIDLATGYPLIENDDPVGIGVMIVEHDFIVI
jgi:hypothetical protein